MHEEWSQLLQEVHAHPQCHVQQRAVLQRLQGELQHTLLFKIYVEQNSSFPTTVCLNPVSELFRKCLRTHNSLL